MVDLGLSLNVLELDSSLSLPTGTKKRVPVVGSERKRSDRVPSVPQAVSVLMDTPVEE